MSARKTTSNSVELLRSASCLNECLKLPVNEVRLRKSGIEFTSQRPMPQWTEMTVSLQIPRETHVVHCTGIIVACNGNRQSGYQISMLFTNLSPQSQACLGRLRSGVLTP